MKQHAEYAFVKVSTGCETCFAVGKVAEITPSYITLAYIGEDETESFLTYPRENAIIKWTNDKVSAAYMFDEELKANREKNKDPYSEIFTQIAIPVMAAFIKTSGEWETIKAHLNERFYPDSSNIFPPGEAPQTAAAN